MKQSDSIAALAAALAKAQGAITGAKKDAENPHFRSKYADLASVWEAARPALTAHGLSVIQTFDPSDKDEIIVDTRLLHESGEWIEGRIAVPVTKADAQGYGSAATYARRYSLAAMVGVAPEDDDGNAAAGAKPRLMSTGEFAKHKGAIGAAQNELELRGAYTTGYVEAQRIGDMDAILRLTALKDERKKELPPTVRPNTATQVAVDALDALSDETKDFLNSHAKELHKLFDAKGDMAGYIEAQQFDTESKLALWALLPSNVRAEIKRQQGAVQKFQLAGQA